MSETMHCVLCGFYKRDQSTLYFNASMAVYIDMVETLVFVAFTQHCIKSYEMCENSTLYMGPVTHPHIFLPVTFLIFNGFSIRKSFEMLKIRAF